MAITPRAFSDWTPWAYAVVVVPLVLILVEYLRGAAHELTMVRDHTLRATMQESRTLAMGRAKGLEVLLDAHAAVEQPWAEKRGEQWLARYWSGIELIGSHELYAAVVDDSGTIVMHTDPASIGRRLEREWYERRATEAGPDVVWAAHSALCPDRAVYNVALPLSVADRTIGEFHQGVDAKWMDSKIADEQRKVRGRWLAVLALVGVVDAAAVGAMVFLARRESRAWRSLRGKGRERARVMAQIGAGLAHEVRNPLHAMRINLHTLRRAVGGRTTLPQEELLATIQESDVSINRLDELMRDLLQFTDPTLGDEEEVDMVQEVRSMLNLLSEDLRRDAGEVQSELPSRPIMISMDPIRLRQVLQNLFTFAQHRAGKNGTIGVRVAAEEGGVALSIRDSGPEMPASQRAHVFEPFQAPVETGSGLGLALVQTFVEEVGGRVSFDGDGEKRCRVWFPLATTTTNGDLR